jgi:hexulose-6-phosphate isomerase
MKRHFARRDFLKVSVGAACAAPLASLASAAAGPTPALPGPTTTSNHIRKAVQINMLPKQLSYADRFKLARDAGFENVEGQTVMDPNEAEAVKQAADNAGIHIHSVMNMAHWDNPLSSSDPEVVRKSLIGMKASLHNAELWGADAVLLVPAVVNPETSYKDAWTRSQQQIRTLIPLAEDLKVVIAIEEVWNKFLLSPLEMAQYVDEFKSPWIKAYFDVGNVVLYGYPQDWIHTLGNRIAKVHLKDFKLNRREGNWQWKNLGEGDIDWAAVRQAFADVGYTGYATTELPGGDEAYLHDVAQRVDKLVLGL